MNQRYADKMRERLFILLPTETKCQLFDVSRKTGVPVSELARRGIASIIETAS